MCDFFSSSRGCVKGNECGFLHVKRYNPLGEECNRVCDFYLTPAGCIKGMQCNFAHPRAIPAEKAGRGARRDRDGSERGERGERGAGNERKFGEVSVRGTVVSIGGERVCEFYLTPTGCTNGADCKYLHPRGEDAKNALKAKAWANKSKSFGGAASGGFSRGPSTRGGRGGRDGREGGAVEKKDKSCQFFATEQAARRAMHATSDTTRHKAPCSFCCVSATLSVSSFYFAACSSFSWLLLSPAPRPFSLLCQALCIIHRCR